MKHLYTLYLLLLLSAMGYGVQAQVRSSNASAIGQSGEFTFYGDKVIDPRSDVRLFPNPAVEYLIIEISSEGLTNISFELNNIIGNAFAIRSESLGGNRYKVWVKDLRPGYYFITLKDESSTYKRTYRFLKK
ncbi:T9SS type A sorting domain-containing protein [Cesiribacter andamanensis]|uniref:Secretion system C-terminal sorting domain-containing protein n=1 Tax=Cesiribacter andamanensis AMV16 TaxID=1279009 RepID=M7NIL7_9BACT|nr:T9SS type A sorting domain-containing protein [Cesiribacter andamanensis]EMR01620.1 hypothetical protein ADICEAN_03242 [Cesiribacter andamanensis AMV16]